MRRSLLLSVVLLFVSFGVSFAQNGVVKGKITDKKNGEGLQGARVTLTLQSSVATKIGRIAGRDGSFEIGSVPAGKYSAEVTYVGYKAAAQALTVDAGATVDANFALTLDIKGLEEVVVTGVASRTQKGVAEVAVARVNASEFTDKVGYTTAGQLLSGKVAGVTITPASGTVGGGIRFNVRSGAGLFGGSPVIFVDGVRISSGNIGYASSGAPGAGGQGISALADLNPNDIESIEVLKGAAASALYGTSGQNGVVLIKTKRGRGLTSNELTINYQGIYGYNTPARLYTEDMALSYKEANSIFRTKFFEAPIVQHGVNLQGNSGIFNYYLGFEDRQESGIVQQNELRRQSFRLNLDAVTSRDFSISGSVNYVSNFITRPQNDNNILGWLGNTLLFSPVAADAVANGGGPIPRPFGTYQFTDSTAIAAAENAANISRVVASTEIRYAPSWLPGFTLRGLVGYENQNVRFESFFPATEFYSGVQSGARTIFTLFNERLNVDASAAYEAKDLFMPGLNSTTTLGLQVFNFVTRNNLLSAQRFGTDLVRDISSGGSTTFSINEFFQNNREAGIFIREELNLNQTFFLSGAVRNDFASALNNVASTILYPQASGMVRLDKLGFLPEVVNLFKIRVAYGETGSLPGVLDGQRLVFTTAQSGAGPGGIVQVLGNPGILPERIRETEIGFEFELDNAYGGEFTYIIGNASNSLINTPRAPSTGLNGVGNVGIRRNLGRIDQWGFESNLYARVIQSVDYALEFNVIFNFFDNIVRDLGASEGAAEFIQDGFTRQFLIAGQRRSQFIGPKPITPRFRADGYYDYVSGPIPDTARANGAIYTPNGVFLGSPIGPSSGLYTGSFSVNFKFLRDFTLYALAEFNLGGYIYNGTRGFHTNPQYANNIQFNRLANQLGLARGQAGSAGNGAIGNVPRYAEIPALTPNTPEYRAAAEQFMKWDWISLNRGSVYNFTEPANWARLREVSLRWNATRLFNDAGIGVKNLAFSLTGTNLFLLTNYTGIEVETNGNPEQVLSQGQDFLTLQQARAFNFMVSLGF
jgi:TonB-dependent starch-binding outer membrane protein SusC